MKPTDAMVTADTITDIQINRVRVAMVGVPRKTSYHRAIIQDCDAALRGDRTCRESAAYAYNKLSGWADAHSVTDEQIQALLEDKSLPIKDRVTCSVALRIPVGRSARAARNRARDRVAELLNARFAK